jgi:uncharacterized protein (TIGR03067 family)
MTCKWLGLTALVCLAAWCGSAAAWDKGELTDNAETTIPSPLHGSWVLVSSEINGIKEVAPTGNEESVLTFNGDRFLDKFIVKRGRQIEEGIYKLNDSKMPKEIDHIMKLERKYVKGVLTFKGIYRIEGDTLKLAFSYSGPRPTAFESKDDNSVVMIFKRKN